MEDLELRGHPDPPVRRTGSCTAQAWPGLPSLQGRLWCLQTHTGMTAGSIQKQIRVVILSSSTTVWQCCGSSEHLWIAAVHTVCSIPSISSGYRVSLCSVTQSCSDGGAGHSQPQVSCAHHILCRVCQIMIILAERAPCHVSKLTGSSQIVGSHTKIVHGITWHNHFTCSTVSQLEGVCQLKLAVFLA